ncbi:endonuclease domain-containing 1 protein-like [Puntigrus tetrazona]|uniref:endonuclease domain-containing 1 protein-like n=1 Tax=Puntigrus tetrazona TaxID=1606681 RepID=UPI001C897EEC|nr:endonuclease domain-containing 1 protein-like [Puntigrus tetrazona]
MKMKMWLFVVSVLLVIDFPIIKTEVVNSFEKCKNYFLNEQPPVIPGILNNSDSTGNNRYKQICQKYKNAYRFATLYDTENKIPVFSAYIYEGKKENFTRPNPKWMIESELESPVAEMTVLTCANQAIREDYRNNSYNVDRGHLFPSCHAANKVTAKSTFTLTNVVPQKISFNGGSWSRMEEKTKNIMDTCINSNNNVSAHVLTGAIPGEIKLNKKVNIPLYLWMAFCCYNKTEEKWVSQAYWAENIEENPVDEKTIEQKSVRELQNFFNETWVPNVQLFDNYCK